MKNIITAVFILFSANTLAQDYTGIYELKNTNGSTGTLSLRKLRGSNYSAQVFAWWNLQSARHGIIGGDIVFGTDNKGSSKVGFITDSCIITIEMLDDGASVKFKNCESDNVTEDFNGYYAKTNSVNPIFEGETRKYRVVSKRSYFYHSVDAGAPTKVFIVRDDVITATVIRNDFVFAEFTNSEGKRKTGWLELETLKEIK